MNTPEQDLQYVEALASEEASVGFTTGELGQWASEKELSLQETAQELGESLWET